MAKEKKLLTEAQEKALLIVREHGPVAPSQFSDLMWPDSPAHRRSYKCGPSGSTRGRGIVRSAGGFLAKLRRRGWVEEEYSILTPGLRLGYNLTVEGHEILKQAGVA